MNYCPEGSFPYFIQPNDTLWELSQTFKTDLNAIIEANPGIDPNNLLIGQMICIPLSDIFYNDVMFDTSKMMDSYQMPVMPGMEEQLKTQKFFMDGKRNNSRFVGVPPVAPVAPVTPMPFVPGGSVAPLPGAVTPIPTVIPTAPVPVMAQTTALSQVAMVDQCGKPICPLCYYPSGIVPTEPTPAVIPDADLVEHLQMLWIEHINWMVNVINDTVLNLPNLLNSTRRLYRNAEDFSEALEPFFYDQYADRFEELFKEHIKIGMSMVTALKNKNLVLAQNEEKRWYQNADTIAQFLASINQVWTEDEWRKLLYDHLRLVKTYATLVVNNNLEQATFMIDDMEQQALDMADYMIYGIESSFSGMIS